MENINNTSTAIPEVIESDLQIRLIKSVKRAYLITLNDPKDGMSALRYSVYLDTPEGLQILWPQVQYINDKPKVSKLLPHQVSTERRNYPKFHFALSGCGYSKDHELASMLRRINPALEVYTLSGYAASLVSH